MYTFNTQLGIGKVNGIENGMVEIYFEDVDKTKKVPVDFVSVYSTEEEAEEASDEKMTIDQVEAILLAEKNRHIDRMNNQEAIRLINLETSMNCAKSL